MKNQRGYLEVIAGPMFSGKTEELIRQVKRAVIGKKKIQFFKPSIDARYGKEEKLYSLACLTVHKRVAKGKTVDPHLAHPTLVSKLDLSVYQARCRRCFHKA